MSLGPVARWLETFVCSSMCKQYVEVFQEFGYNNLNEICNLNSQQLLKMGVTRFDAEKIMENVSVLKQTMQANTINQGFQSYPSRDQLDHHIISTEVVNMPNNQVKQGRKNANKANKSSLDSKQKQLLPINQVVPNTTNGKKARNAKNNKNDKNNIQSQQIITDNILLDTNMSNDNFNYGLHTNPVINNFNNNSLVSDAANKKSVINNNNNDILNKASRYSCLPISNSNSPVNYGTNQNPYEFQANQYQHQYQQQQQQYRHHHQQQHQQQYPQAKSPSILLSPISNPSSSSLSSSSSSTSSSSSSSPSASSLNITTNLITNQYNQQHQQQVGVSTMKPNTGLAMAHANKSNGLPTSNQSSYMYQNNLAMNQAHYYGNNSASTNNWNNNSQDYYSNNNNQAYYNGYSSPYAASNQTYQKANTTSYGNQTALPTAGSLNTNSSSKNSPLEYLERLALLPEAQVVDPKSIVNENNANEAATLNSNYTEPLSQSYDLGDYQQQQQKSFNKRNLNDIPDQSASKKLCNNSNSNSPNFKANFTQPQQQQHYVPNSGASTATNKTFQQLDLTGFTMNNQRSTQLLNDSPSSSSSTTSSNSSTSSACFNAVLPHSNMFNDDEQLNNDDNIQPNSDDNSNNNNNNSSTNIIDASNFDFLDYLPELNSTTIDQTITTATSFSNINLGNTDHLENIDSNDVSFESIYQQQQPTQWF